jgi:phage terminase large subunit
MREAMQELARDRQVIKAPVVIWASPHETEELLAARVARARRRGCRIIVAVRHGFRVPAGVQAVEFAQKHFGLLNPEKWFRYLIASGGRGTAKSWSIADYIILRCLAAPCRVLCAREFQRSLRESSAHLLADRIRALNLGAWFDIYESEIKCFNGSEIIFGGLGVNAQSLQSLENVNVCWLEQAETISARSLEILVPTIRAPGSQIIISLNPDSSDAPVMQLINGDRPDVRHVHTTYLDNPWWGETLENERVQLLRTDPDAHAHIYLGTTRTHSKASVFAGKYSIEEFEPPSYRPGVALPANWRSPWHGPYLGADWGFSQDPSVLVLCWVASLDNSIEPRRSKFFEMFGEPSMQKVNGPRVLYVEHEAVGVGVDIDKTPELFDQVPGARRRTIRADCSRPETIRYMQQHGYRGMVAARKWRNCVEDGVSFLRGFERIILHPRCTHAAEECRLYQYKIDRLTGDVLPDLEDRNNHVIDALRYALDPVMRAARCTVTPLRI